MDKRTKILGIVLSVSMLMIMMASVRLPWDMSLQLSGRYHSRQILAQGSRDPRYRMDGGVKKSLGNWALSVNVRDILDSRKWNQVTYGTDFIQKAERRGGLDATVRWQPLAEMGAQGCNVRYGVAPDKLYHSHLVYGQNEVTLCTLTVYGFGVIVYGSISASVGKAFSVKGNYKPLLARNFRLNVYYRTVESRRGIGKF